MIQILILLLLLKTLEKKKTHGKGVVSSKRKTILSEFILFLQKYWGISLERLHENYIKASFEHLPSSILKEESICLCFYVVKLNSRLNSFSTDNIKAIHSILPSGAHINTRVTSNSCTNQNKVWRSFEGEDKFNCSLKPYTAWLNDFTNKRCVPTCILTHTMCCHLAGKRKQNGKQHFVYFSWAQIELKATMKLNVPWKI